MSTELLDFKNMPNFTVCVILKICTRSQLFIQDLPCPPDQGGAPPLPILDDVEVGLDKDDG